jgi:ABC-type uncharacterized transport system ATPase subunit
MTDESCVVAGADLAVQTVALSKSYDGVHAVDSVDLRVPQHSVFGFLGPNGAGKTIRPDTSKSETTTSCSSKMKRRSCEMSSWLMPVPIRRKHSVGDTKRQRRQDQSSRRANGRPY